MEIDERPANSKPESQPGRGTGGGRLLKRIEDAVQLMGLDSRTSVAYFHMQRVTGIGRAYEYCSLGWRKFYRIAQQVAENLTEAGRICFKPGVFRSELLASPGNTLTGVGKADIHRFSQNRVGIREFFFERQLSAANAGQIEKIVNQPRLRGDIAADRRGSLSDVAGAIGILFE